MIRLSSRGLAGLLAAGVVLIALALWVSSRQPSPSAGGSGALVFPGLESALNTVTRVRLSKAGGPDTTLEKEADDWIVAERGYPADSGLVRQLLLDLARLKVVERKTSDPASYPVIGVEDLTAPHATGTRIDLVEPHKTVSLIVGNPSGNDASFVRRVGAKTSLLVSPQLMPQTDPKQWLYDAVVNLPESRVKDVRVALAGQRPYLVSRGSAKQLDFTIPDLPRGRELSSVSAPNAVANALSSLTLDDVKKVSGPQNYPDHAVFRTFDGLEVQVSGRKEGASRYIALSATALSKADAAEAHDIDTRFAGWELEILGYQYDAIFQPLEGLLKPLPAKPRAKAHARAKRAKA